MSVRKAAVAGAFYPSDAGNLLRLIDSCYTHPLGPGRPPPADRGDAQTVACVVPHAGYEYSGPVAAHSYFHISSLPDPELIVIVAPNHYGVGSGVSSCKGGEWETPLGRMKVDGEAARGLAEACDIVDFDPESHRIEHSLEVQLPFLQRIYGSRVPFVPLSISFQDARTTGSLASGISTVLKGRKGVLIASSDFTHYEPGNVAKKKDMQLIREIEAMDVDSFYSTLERLEVTACGYGAIATVMQVSRSLGFKHGELLKYASSGDTTGDYTQVVGYGSLRFL